VQPKRRILTLAMLACLAVSLFSAAYPIYVIRPFRHQGARELAIALVVARFRAMATIALAIAAILAWIAYWRAQPRKLWRALATAGAVVAVVLAFLGRINIYELMFHPDGHPSFAAAREAKLDADEKLIAVRIGGEARAYPIRIMSYHHVVNDVVANVAIVATY
jgi:ABC-type transport system involved in cytochrome c biogenesis permease subunit